MISPRTSSVGFASRLVGDVKGEINFEEMSDEQLKLTLDEAMRTNRTLTLENEVFERYLRRKEPHCLRKLSKIVESARQAQKISHLRPDQLHGSRIGSTASLTGSAIGDKTSSVTSVVSGFFTRTTSGSQQTSVGTAGVPKQPGVKGLKITVAHRIDLAEKETEEMRRQYENFERGATRKKDALEARSSELKQRIIECNESIAQFENNVVNEIDPITKRIPVVKFLRFMSDQSKWAAAIIDKLNLKIVTTKRLISYTKDQIKQREEVGTTLRPIDFEQVQIETEYLIDENEQNHMKLRSLKKMSGFYNLMLKYHKEKLFDRKLKLRSIEEELISKERENFDFQRAQIREKRETNKAQTQLNHIKKLQNECEVPEVSDFLNVQRQLQEAKKMYKRLSRRRKIQLFSLNLRRNSL